MEEMVTIPKKEYEELKRRAADIDEILDDTEGQAKRSLEDLKHGRVVEFTDVEDS